MSNHNSYKLNVLLADDDSDDRMFFNEAVSSLHLDINLVTVKDGAKLMSYLLGHEAVLPDILFLDLNMPFKTGFQCLTEIRQHPGLQDIFVIIYSTTANPREIDEAFKMQANLFIQKPNTFTELKLILAKVFALNLKQYQHPEKAKFVLDTY
jgi:CheY-like chemotaxis protein